MYTVPYEVKWCAWQETKDSNRSPQNRNTVHRSREHYQPGHDAAKVRGQGASTDGDADGFERARGVATKVDDECEAGGGSR